MIKQLNEALKYKDLENQLIPVLGIDQFESKIGADSDYITLNLILKSKLACDDVITWLQRGYDYIEDADKSPGEVNKGKYLVFFELERRSSSSEKIMEILSDMDTLTGVKAEEWKFRINDQLHPASKETIEKLVPLSPHEYREQNEESEEDDEDLNEMRIIAGLDPVTSYNYSDQSLQNMQRQAGII